MPLHESLARPYAKAVLMLANETQSESNWVSFLENAASIASQPSIFSQLKRVFLEESVATEIANLISTELSANQAQIQLLKLLSENKRLVLLPLIYSLFLEQVEAQKNIHSVLLKTAIPLDETLRNQFESALQKKLGGKIILKTEVDERILGGAIISMKDDVIDASMHNQLRRLFEFSLKV